MVVQSVAILTLFGPVKPRDFVVILMLFGPVRPENYGVLFQ